MSYFKGDCKVKVLNKNSLLEEKKISDIKVRDTIVSWDDLAEEWTYSKVKEIYSDKKLSDFCEQNIELGYEGIGYFSINSDKNLRCTPSTSFLTLMGWQSFFPISSLQPYKNGAPIQYLGRNQVVFKTNGYWKGIESVEFIPCTDEIVYSLNIKEHYTYLVSDFLVHDKRN